MKNKRMLILIIVTALALAVLLMAATGAWARTEDAQALATAAPAAVLSNTISFQGRLLDSGGKPVEGARVLTFRLYTDALNGTLLWSQTGSVPVNDGLFTAYLDVNPLLFDGQALWLSVQVQGDAQELSPRQPLLSAPYAFYALRARWAGLMDVPPGLNDGDDNTTYTPGLGLTLDGTEFAISTTYRLPQGCGDGEIAEWDATGRVWYCGSDDVGGGGAAWLLSGNVGTTYGADVLGTADGVSLTLVVSDRVALRLEPTAGTSNLIGGHSANRTAAGAYGATIGGGGSSGADANRVTDHYGTVGGGAGNRAGNDDGDAGSAAYATIGGGEGNMSNGTHATVGGGWGNTAGGVEATVGGGTANTAGGQNSTVGGGWGNVANNWHTTVSGGLANTASGDKATIGGGHNNIASGFLATIGGGYTNTASNSDTTIGGGVSNTASGYRATIGGGAENVVSGTYGAIGGGESNIVSGTYGTVSGGYDNTVGGGNATVGGGMGNTASGGSATVGGGWINTASGPYATIAGGYSNSVNGSDATIGGGTLNTASGSAATIPGGVSNVASGAYSFAGGAQAQATHQGSFVWSSAESASSWYTNTFTVRAHGGARFYSASGTGTGVQLSSGGTSWASISDRNAKENLHAVDGARLLGTLAAMPIQTWNLRSQAPEMRHIGPVAQDFNGAFAYLFGEVESPIHINTMDAVGISLAAAQGLYAQNQALQAENVALQQQVDDLEVRVAAIEATVGGTAPARPLQSNLLPGMSLALVGLVGLAWWRRKGGAS